MNHRANVLELTRQIAAARFGRQHPIYLVHALTARCNARCGFCAWNPEFYDPRQQLSTPAIKQLYRDARRAGFVGLSIWGGEPLVYPDFDEVVSHARELGFFTNMVTNGFLLRKKLGAVVDNIDKLSISLDHPSSQHDEMRGIRGLFEEIVAGVRALRARDPKKTVIFVCTLQKANVDTATLRRLCELCGELGVLGVFNGFREEAATDGDAGLSRYAASQAQLREAFVFLSELKRQGYPILNSHTHMKMMQKGPPEYRCHWPKFMLPVEANGDVVDCMHWGTRPIANLKETSLDEVLRHPRLRELAGPEGESCHKCVSIHRVEISEVCEGNLEPVVSWAKLKQPKRLPVLRSSALFAG